MYGCVRSMLSALLPLLLLALTMTYAAGQQAPQGGTASFYATGTDAPPVLTWEVLLSGTVVGSSSSSGGWSVAWNSPLFTVRAPKTAKVSSGYTVRYRPDYRSASFSVIAGATGGLNQPNGGTGGGCGGGGGGEAAGRSI